MFIGEDRNKIRNIVKPHLVEFEQLYSPYLSDYVERGSNRKLRKVIVRGLVIKVQCFLQ